MNLLWKAALPVACLLLMSCDGLIGAEQETEDFHQSYSMSSGGHLDLTSKNGSVEITGTGGNTVEVSGTKYAQSREDLKQIKVEMRQDGNRLTIRTDTGHDSGWHNGGRGVRFRIRLPKQFVLDRVETSNGSISARDLEGGGRIHSTNGKLELADLRGDYRADTTNGSVELNNCDGLMHVETTNGSVRGNLQAGAIDASSTNGSLDLTVEHPQANRPMRLSTSNGGVKLALGEFHKNDIHAETSNGGVTLRLPENTNANLNVSTSLASIHSDLKLTQTDEVSKHRLRGRLGDGGADIEAATNMGAIRLERF